MLARFIHIGIDVEWQDAHYHLQTGRVYDLHLDGTVDVLQSNGAIVNVEPSILRSAVYHPEGTGKLPIKRYRYNGPFECVTCHTALTKENTSPSELRPGGHCRACRGALTKRTEERKKS